MSTLTSLKKLYNKLTGENSKASTNSEAINEITKADIGGGGSGNGFYILYKRVRNDMIQETGYYRVAFPKRYFANVPNTFDALVAGIRATAQDPNTEGEFYNGGKCYAGLLNSYTTPYGGWCVIGQNYELSDFFDGLSIRTWLKNTDAVWDECRTIPLMEFGGESWSYNAGIFVVDNDTGEVVYRRN